MLGQGVDHIEVIVVDDGSSDDTPAVLDRLTTEDKRVRAVRNEDPVGPCAARNRGIEIAEGDFIATCDDDDEWMAGAGPTMLDFMREHPDVGAASSWHEVVHGNKRATFRGPLRYSARTLLWMNVVAIPFIFIRRASFAQDPRYDTEIRIGEDWELCLRCALERPIRTVPVALYSYRQHGTSRVTRDSDMPARTRQSLMALVSKHGQRMSKACVIYHQAVAELAVGGRAGATRLLRSEALRSPRAAAAAARAASLLAMNTQAAKIGVRRADPGLPFRLTARAVGR